MSVAPLCAMAANLASMQILRHALGLGRPLADSMIEYCGFTNKTTISPLRRKADCPYDHERWNRATPPRALRDCTPAELANAAGLAGESPLVLFNVNDMPFVERGSCRCKAGHAVRRFIQEGEPAGRCESCGGPIVPSPFHTHKSVSAETLGPAMDQPLHRLGAGSASFALVRGDGASWLFRQPRCHEEAA